MRQLVAIAIALGLFIAASVFAQSGGPQVSLIPSGGPAIQTAGVTQPSDIGAAGTGNCSVGQYEIGDTSSGPTCAPLPTATATASPTPTATATPTPATWTPVINASTAAPTVGYSVQAGRYYNDGNTLHFSFFVQWSSISGGSGKVQIDGLPTACVNVANGFGQHTLRMSGVTMDAGYSWVDLQTKAASSSLFPVESGSGVNAAQLAIGALNSSGDMSGSGFCFVN